MPRLSQRGILFQFWGKLRNLPPNHRSSLRGILVLLVALILPACSPLGGGPLAGGSLIRSEQAQISETIFLNADYPSGQSFVTRFAGLQGVALYLEPDQPGDGRVNLQLSPVAEPDVLLAENSLALNAVSQGDYYDFAFELPDAAVHQAYLLQIHITGSGSLRLGGAPGNSYLNGGRYLDNQPVVDGQLAFKLAYGGAPLLFGLLRESLTWLLYALAGAWLFVLPGWALLVFARLHTKIDWSSQLALAGGVGLALSPLLFLLADQLGLQPGVWYAWLPSLLGAAYLLYRLRAAGWKPTGRLRRVAPVDLAFVILVALIFLARFWSGRDLAGPMWGDSLQHSMMTQLMLDHGGLFDAWLPYTPYSSQTTHFGFSTQTAGFAWLTGLPAVQATLWFAQLLNGLAVLSLYPLAVRLAKGQRWAGIGALLVAGLLAPMPAYYVNWGRFAQLSGQAILPVALWLLWSVLEGTRLNRRAAILAGLTLAGMSLSYYRMPFFYASFAGLLLLFWGLPRWSRLERKWLWMGQLALTAGVALACLLPWAASLLGGKLAATVEAGVASGMQTQRLLVELRQWQQISNYLPLYLLALSGVSLLAALWRRAWLVAALPLWPALLVAYLAGGLIKLPGASLLQSFTILIALYLPVSLMLGWLVGQLAELRPDRTGWLLVGCLLVGLLGFNPQRTISEPETYAMLTFPDLAAAEWIRANTPDNSLFLVHGFQYAWNSAVGSDAGWWLPLLAGRANSMPPQYALLNESPLDPGYNQRVIELTAQLESNPIADPATVAMLCDWGITHIYNGQRLGQVGGFGGIQTNQLFTVAELQASPQLFQLLYARDQVAIFALDPAACPNRP